MFELNTALTQWTHIAFITLMGHTLLLFVAGALALPVQVQSEHDRLLDYFDEDGHWSILALAAYAALSFWTNWSLFGTSPFSRVGAIVGSIFVLALVGFFARARWLQGAVAIAFLVTAGVAYVALTPAQY